MTHAIDIVPFRPELAPAFTRLNQAWIERLFRIEPTDLTVLNDPEGQIIRTGGMIFFAIDTGEPIGTVAAVRTSADLYELAKMAVDPSHQGRGIGEQLGRAAIAHARSAGAERMFLETNSGLPNAIRLYERLGFAHTARPQASHYDRSDVYMELRLLQR